MASRSATSAFRPSATALALVLLGLGCSEPGTGSSSLFEDRAAAVGLSFTHTHGGDGDYYFVETMSAGAALLDYDNDGDLDAYLVQGHPLVAGGGEARPDPSFTDRLFRNELTPSDPATLAFTDITEESGLRATGYGVGVATGDFDNDGWVDLYLTNFGPNQLWRNNGNGTFSEVPGAGGAQDPGWSTGAVFFDFDGDGWLDLYVANYVEYRLASARPCRSQDGDLDYCGPLAYDPEAGRLFRNEGDGTFTDVSRAGGVLGEKVNGLGVVAMDLDGNGWMDVYVASDQTQNLLWMNLGQGTLSNEALLSGAAVNRNGSPEAGMGIAVADFDADGLQDLFVTHLTGETNTLYRNAGDASFVDVTDESGLGAPSTPYTGFGVAAIDVDNDGWLDLAVVNGAVRREDSLSNAAANPYRQRDQLFRNLGSGRFEELPEELVGFGPAAVGRGLAAGDVDNDGDPDLLVSNNGAAARLLLNQSPRNEAWVSLRIVDRHGRDALGAVVEARSQGAPTLWRTVGTAASYCSSHDPRVLLGLGQREAIDELFVHWPGGPVESFDPPRPGRHAELRESHGRPSTG